MIKGEKISGSATLQKICCSQSPQAVPACPCAEGRIDQDTVLGSREVKVMAEQGVSM